MAWIKNSHEFQWSLSKSFLIAYKNRKTTNFPQKSENIEDKLNIFVGSNNQKSLPRKTKILNKSVTNFEVKMQMAKGCEKWKKIEILGRWRTILALEFTRKNGRLWFYILETPVWHEQKNE